jgi:hypothetical protein
MLEIKLTEKQRKEFLKSFSEIDMQKELKVLFEKMYKSSVYILQGTDEFGKDLIIKEDTPTGIRYISVVVKMGDISGAVKDTQLMIVRNQIEQSFKTNFHINDKIGKQIVNQVFVVLFGVFSNNAQENIKTFLTEQYYSRDVKLFDINDMDKLFVKHYPEIFCGASGLEALTKKDKELDELLLQKDKFLLSSFIEPNIKKFNKNIVKDLSISHLSDEQMLMKTINENLFGVEESITTFAQKLLNKKQHILIEGEAGSGKSVFSMKLAQKFINIAINELPTSKKSKEEPIKVPILITSLHLVKENIDDLVNNYYQDSTYNFTPIVIIIDGLDEVSKQDRHSIVKKSTEYAIKHNISLIFTCRKNHNLIDNLEGFLHYEILAFEIAQAINYIKKLVINNDILLESLLKGLRQIQHQIPLYPMALSLLVDIVREHDEVPASISELYSKYINLALGEKDLSKGIEVLFEYKIKKNFLSELSYDLFFLKNTTVIEYDTFFEFTENYVKSHPHINNATDFIDELKRSSLLTFDENNKIGFLHKSFLDYFIADHFLSNRDELTARDEFEKIYELYYIDFWMDVSLFFFGIQTKITKQILDKIIKIGEEKRSKSESPLITIELFMLGRLMQYAWDSKSETKELMIQYASDIILNLRPNMLNLLKEKIKVKNLPAIFSDIAILHLFDLSYSSLFLVKEIENFVAFNFNRLKNKDKIEEVNDKSLLYFSSIFILTNHRIVDKKFMANFFNDFLLIEQKIEDKEVIIPLIKLFNTLIDKENLYIKPTVKEKLQERYKRISKKLSDLFVKTFIVKNKNEQPYYRPRRFLRK